MLARICDIVAAMEKQALAKWSTWEGPQMIRFLTKAFYSQAAGSNSIGDEP